MKNVVTIGGGSGQSNLLKGLKNIPEIEITAIVSMFDSGGSTGRLRKELGVLPPGDILKCLLALSGEEKIEKFLKQRFEKNKLKGHSLGNLLLVVLSQYEGDFSRAVDSLGEVLGSPGRVLPVTTDKASLVAVLENGEEVWGEGEIDVPQNENRAKVEKIYLSALEAEKVRAEDSVITALGEADFIILSPGDIYTSLLPNLLVGGVVGAIQESEAKLIYLGNLTTKPGESDNFQAEDFVLEIEKYLERGIDYAVFNNNIPGQENIEKLISESARPVYPPEKDLAGRIVIKEDLWDRSSKNLKHSRAKTASLISKLIKEK